MGPKLAFVKKHWKWFLGGFIVLAAIGGIQEQFKKDKEKQPAQTQTQAAAGTTSPTASATPVAAPTPAATPDIAKEIQQYRSTMKSVDKNGTFILSVEPGLTTDHLNITVANQWHYEPYQIRLQMGQALWKLWAGIHSPKDPDKARISLRDQMGNEVGGSRILGGSLIWVQEQ